MRGFENIHKKILNEAEAAGSETELQIEVTQILRDYFKKFGINYKPHQNRTVVTGRPDSLYGTVVIEYKEPHRFDSKRNYEIDIKQTQVYIQELEKKYPIKITKYVGILLDGFKIGFTKFRNGEWKTSPCYDLTAETTRMMFEYLHGLSRKPLHPDFILDDFGPKSQLAKDCIKILYSELIQNKKERVNVLYSQWALTFDQVCGYNFTAPKASIKKLVKSYEIMDKKIDLKKLLFSIHTYYATVIKFLAAEISVTYVSPIFSSFLEEVLASSPTKLKEKLEDLEEGGIFSDLGIKNFLEGDFFSWYLDTWNKKIRDVINSITRKLVEYEPATASLEPEQVRDLLKKLYQYLVPPKIRHDLGEYFTPDWLAEYLLSQVPFKGDSSKRILDPGCGSGTFLVMAIKKIKESQNNSKKKKSDLLNEILDNVIGFDLNPLAVIAARTNYLVALGDLIRQSKNDIHIPVYLCDSISTKVSPSLFGNIFEISTSVGKFRVPADIVNEKLLDPIFSVVDQCIKNNYEKAVFLKTIKNEFKDLTQPVLDLLDELFQKLQDLEHKGINRIWTRVLKNAFAPHFTGKYDFVVGNPPWINWESLPRDYRESTKSLWFETGIITKQKGVGLGKSKKDVSMLFVAISVERYLNESGKLAFLVPFTLFKMQAGGGFRKFLTNKTKVKMIHDMVELRPFENAINRTSLLILSKGRTEFPFTGSMWTKKTSGEIDQFLDLNEVKKITQRTPMVLQPISSDIHSSWLMVTPKALPAVQKVLGISLNQANAGVYTDINGVYWVSLIGKQAGKILIENLGDIGEKKVQEINCSIEPELIFPLLRGRDVKKWGFDPSIHIVLPVDTDGKTFSLDILQSNYPRTFNYFNKFFKDLISRGGEPYKKKLKDWHKRKIPNKNSLLPFYWIVNAKPSLAKYKVVWKYIAGAISGKGEFIVSPVTPITDKNLGEKTVITDHRLIVIQCKNKNEMYYLSGMLNSSIIRLAVKSYTIETAISTHVLKNIRIPQYNPMEKLHKKIIELSKNAHDITQGKSNQKILEVENQLDEKVRQIYDIRKKEMVEVKSALEIM